MEFNVNTEGIQQYYIKIAECVEYVCQDFDRRRIESDMSFENILEKE